MAAAALDIKRSVSIQRHRSERHQRGIDANGSEKEEIRNERNGA